HHLSDPRRGDRLPNEPEGLRRRLRQAPITSLAPNYIGTQYPLAPKGGRLARRARAGLATGREGAYLWPDRLNPDWNHDLTHHVAPRSRRPRSPGSAPTPGPRPRRRR